MENQPNKFSNSMEGTIENDVTKELNKNILENPDGFVAWFDNLKNSITKWGEKFFTDTALRKAILILSIPAAILKGGNWDANAAEVTALPEQAVASSSVEAMEVPQRIKSDELIALEDSTQQEIVAMGINYELEAFNTLSKSFNKATGTNNFDFAGRMMGQIQSANQSYREISAIEDVGLREIKYKERTRKVIENGHLNYEALIKAAPGLLGAIQFATLVHETGHANEAGRQGVSSSVDMGLFTGFTWIDEGQLKNRAAFDAAGINANEKFGDYIVDSLRGNDTPNQFAAMMALVSKSYGVYYSLLKNRNDIGNDLVSYSTETGVPITNLTVGLTADFILDSDNWKLFEIALGEEGVKIPETSWSFMYKLGEKEPIVGLQYKGRF